MAFADTAKLIVQLDLKGNAAKGLQGINRQIDDLARQSSVRGGISQIGQGIGLGLKRGAIIGGVALAGIATQVKAGVESLRELENVTVQTEAVIRSTGGAAGQTAEGIRRLSERYEDLGGVIDDKVIQSGANVLLTFTNIREKAFEPALEAALDLSTAMDQDLQSSIVQIGKALNDPIRGITALRRVGVQLTDEQEENIKDLVEAGKLEEAQLVILNELSREFGGSFAAAGKTNEATIARFQDSIEGLQQNLATAFLPAIDRVARRLNEIFSDPEVIRGVRRFGDQLAGFLNEENLDRAEEAVRGVFGYLASIPWDAIGSGLQIAGQAAKVAVDAFRSLPPGVQNALITLLAANKLTGGLVASGLGQLLTIAASKLGTIIAGNVTVVGKNIVGGPTGGAPTGGGGGGLLGTLKSIGALASIPLAGIAVEKTISAINDAKEVGEGIRERLDNIDVRTLKGATERLQLIDAQVEHAEDNIVGNLFGLDDRLRDGFAEERANLTRQIGILNASEGARFRQGSGQLAAQHQARLNAIHTLNANEGTRAAAAQARLQEIRNSQATANSTLAQIRDKKSSVQVNVNLDAITTVNFSATLAAVQLARVSHSLGSDFRQDIGMRVF